MAEQEESLSAGLQKHIDRFSDVQKALGDLGSEASSLKSQCDALKSQRLALTTEVTSRTSELSAIRSEVERLTRERDALQLEYKTENEINEWYLRRELSAAASASATPAPGSTGGHSGTGTGTGTGGIGNGNGSHDQLGAARRRAAMWEGKFRDLTRENTLEQTRWEGELEKEKAVAAGLRDRIGTLEERYRSVQAQLNSSEDQRRALSVELENTKEHARSEERRLQGEWADMKQARDTAKSGSEVLQKKLDEAVAAREKVEAELHKLRSAHKSPPRAGALRPLSPNVTVPTTPSKVRHLTSPHPASPSRFATQDKYVTTSPTTALARKYVHLEERNASLRAEMDRLRKKHEEDHRHWKEYKRVEEARQERKKERRRVKKEKSATASLSGQAVEERMAGPNYVLVEESEESGRKVGPHEAGPAEAGTHASVQVSVPVQVQLPQALSTPTASQTAEGEGVEEEEVEYRSQEDRLSLSFQQTQSAGNAPPVVPTMAPAPVPEAVISWQRPPRRSGLDLGSADEIYKRVVPHRQEIHDRVRAVLPPAQGTAPAEKTPAQASRTTAWLGSTSKVRDSTPQRNPDPFDDELESPFPSHSRSTPSAGLLTRTPLVRDRGPADSLRRTALEKTVKPPTTTTPVRAFSPSASSVATSSKRKLADLEGLSPAEKTAQLKRLSKLPASEKREIYAQYKGKGRYLPPEEIKKQALDEYEIDPGQNEGASFAFHDVKRRKAERKHMHGGDCECCKDYYEAVGPLPRFNQGPRWNDASQNEDDAQAIKSHQNKVSRHRDTWTRPPTPPGYWAIGFPTTQDVEAQNQLADQMIAEKEARIRQEATSRDSKWRKKA